MRRITARVVLVLVVLVLTAPAALAGNGHKATGQGYPSSTKPPAGNVSPSSSGVAGTQNTSGTAHATTLPFTGFQLGVVVLVSVLLLGGGIVLRASGRNRSTGAD